MFKFDRLSRTYPRVFAFLRTWWLGARVVFLALVTLAALIGFFTLTGFWGFLVVILSVLCYGIGSMLDPIRYHDDGDV